MPKEYINQEARRVVYDVIPDGDYGFRYLEDQEELPKQTGGVHMERSPVLVIRWGKEGHDEPTPSAIVEMEVAEEEILRMADQIRRERNPEYLPPDEPNEATHMWWSKSRTFHTVVLSRLDLQKLIRVTRRARDSSYGSDE